MAARNGNPPKGFKCRTCGKYHHFGVYVIAHSRDLLQHTCDGCGALHDVQHFRVKQTKPGVIAEQPA